MADHRYTLTVSQAAQLLGVHSRTLYRWAKDGDVPYWETPGGVMRFRHADLMALLPKEPAKSNGEGAA